MKECMGAIAKEHRYASQPFLVRHEQLGTGWPGRGRVWRSNSHNPADFLACIGDNSSSQPDHGSDHSPYSNAKPRTNRDTTPKPDTDYRYYCASHAQ